MNDRHTQNGAAISSDEALQAQLTAYALGQLEGDEREQVEQRLGAAGGAEMRKQVDQIRRLATALNATAKKDGEVSPSAELRSTLLQCLNGGAKDMDQTTGGAAVEPLRKPSRKRSRWLAIALIGGVLSLGAVVLWMPPGGQQSESRAVSMTTPDASESMRPVDGSKIPGSTQTYTTNAAPYAAPSGPASGGVPDPAVTQYNGQSSSLSVDALAYKEPSGGTSAGRFAGGDLPRIMVTEEKLGERTEGETLAAGGLPGDTLTAGIETGSSTPLAAVATPFGSTTEERKPLSQLQRPMPIERGAQAAERLYRYHEPEETAPGLGLYDVDGETNNDFAIVNSEQYDQIVENAFLSPTQQPLSTFSIDVDTASYANVRRFLTSGRLPPPSAVRIEELVNYFSYNYPQPEGEDPFSVNMEMAECPWHEGHRLLRVGLKGKDIHRDERPESNLVFLLDVSGSMDEPNKLPLVKQSMTMLVQELTENDRVSIVTYAGNAGLVLAPTSGDQKRKILDAIESLAPGGSTHGSAGIQLAYDMAGEYFRKGGTNRVILATDGDLNVGVTSDEALVELIKEKAKAGTFLTVLGFGEGNLKDSKMEKIADNGNGVYAYIDGAREGRKVLVEQMTGSLITIAKDVKIQIEFNPAEVASYRLLGYENRVLAAQDFNDDKKDAGEIGAGHMVTALYEVVPVGAEKEPAKAETPTTDPLKYQGTGEPKATDGAAEDPRKYSSVPQLTDAANSGELLTLKLRYKQPDGDTSKLLEYPLSEKGGSFNAASADMQFASAVASFGMLLRQSEHRGTSNMAAVEEIASGSLGKDDGGYRAEFVDLVKRTAAMGVK